MPWVPLCPDHSMISPLRGDFFSPLGSHLRSKLVLSGLSPRHESLWRLSARHSWAIHTGISNFCSENGLDTLKFPGIFHKIIYIIKSSWVLMQASIIFVLCAKLEIICCPWESGVPQATWLIPLLQRGHILWGSSQGLVGQLNWSICTNHVALTPVLAPHLLAFQVLNSWLWFFTPFHIKGARIQL